MMTTGWLQEALDDRWLRPFALVLVHAARSELERWPLHRAAKWLVLRWLLRKAFKRRR